MTTPRTDRSGLPILLLLLATAVVRAQSVSADHDFDPVPPDGKLPAALETSFGGGESWSTDFEMPSTVDERIKLHVWFDNTGAEQLVFLEYFVTKLHEGSTLFTSTVKTYSCPYKITAACRAAGSTDTLYVAGWSERLKRVTVEEWTLGPAAVAVALNQAGQAVLGFTAPAVNREQVFTSVTLAPIEDMVFHDVSRRLLLLEFGPASRLHSLDLDDLVPTVVLDASSHPDFVKVSNIRVSFHTQAGLVLYGRDAPEWSSGANPWFLVVTDSDLDGYFEFGGLVRYEAEAFATEFPASGWVSTY